MNQPELSPRGQISPESHNWPRPAGPEIAPETPIRPPAPETGVGPKPAPVVSVQAGDGAISVVGPEPARRRIFDGGARPNVELPQRRLVETYTRQARGVIATTSQLPAEQKRQLIPLKDEFQRHLSR